MFIDYIFKYCVCMFIDYIVKYKIKITQSMSIYPRVIRNSNRLLQEDISGMRHYKYDISLF